MPLIEPRFRALFLSLFSVFTLFGTSITIIGATLPKILADFQWNYLIAGFVLGAGAVAFFLSTFAGGYMVQHWGAKPTILFIDEAYAAKLDEAGVNSIVIRSGLTCKSRCRSNVRSSAIAAPATKSHASIGSQSLRKMRYALMALNATSVRCMIQCIVDSFRGHASESVHP